MSDDSLEDTCISVDDNGFAELYDFEQSDAGSTPQGTISVNEQIGVDPAIDETLGQVISVACVGKFQDFNEKMRRLKSDIKDFKLNEKSQTHFKKFIKSDGELDSNERESNYTYSRAGLGGTMSTTRNKPATEANIINNTTSVGNILSEHQMSLKYAEAISNINEISKKLLKEVENMQPPAKKNLKDKISDTVIDFKRKLTDTKRDLFFSLVSRAQKVLNIK